MQQKGQTEQNISYFIQFITKKTQVTVSLHKICFKLCTIDLNFKIKSNIFYCPSIGARDDTVSSLVMSESEVHILLTMKLANIFLSLVYMLRRLLTSLLVIRLNSTKVMEASLLLVLLFLTGVS